jgi:hypothetical protein
MLIKPSLSYGNGRRPSFSRHFKWPVPYTRTDGIVERVVWAGVSALALYLEPVEY